MSDSPKTKAIPHESKYARKLRLEREGKRNPFNYVSGPVPREIKSAPPAVSTEKVTAEVVHFDANRGGALLRGDGERKFFLSFRDLDLEIPADFGIGSRVTCEVAPRMGSKHPVVMQVIAIDTRAAE